MLRFFLATLAVVLLAGCSGITVSQDYAPATSFDALNTFAWASPMQPTTGDPRIDNPLRDARTREAVARQLLAKGYIESSDGQPTFTVRYQYVLRRKLESDGGGGRIGFGVGTYGRGGGIAVGTGNSVREYEEASLVIDLLDPATGELLWRGTGNQRYREYKDPEKTSRDINLLVEKILEQFPPDSQ
jgi:hypothetical protein